MCKVVEDVKGSDETKSFSPQLATFSFCLLALLSILYILSMSVVMGLTEKRTLKEIETRKLCHGCLSNFTF